MTLRTGKGCTGTIYRYYTCSTRARQGKAGCQGKSIPMAFLDDLVANHLEKRLLKPERLTTILEAVLGRRQERTERRREHLGELKRKITETDQRLSRLYDAIEAGVTDINDPALKDRMAGLKAIKEQATTDAERIKASLDSTGNQQITPEMVNTFARTARERMRDPRGGYRRDHLRALAQRIEVAEKEVRIIGSKSELLQTLVAASGEETAVTGVRSSVCPSREMGDSSFRIDGLHFRPFARRARCLGRSVTSWTSG
ncbi:zinc ribbon domain-containing protein [Mesorhizobium sp. B2-4-13]|uniref:zinc ribbon domain-containing protein n=1 Tax=Mesorhizobium sp. B2-4-13 TaxID=2589936 RepID=UPI001FEDEEAB|nr:zinc ribbon domain-containing protein [Mesorhizobium sp. B2-4-13]